MLELIFHQTEKDKAMVPLSCCVRDVYDDIINEQKCQLHRSGPPEKKSGDANEALNYRVSEPHSARSSSADKFCWGYFALDEEHQENDLPTNFDVLWVVFCQKTVAVPSWFKLVLDRFSVLFPISERQFSSKKIHVNFVCAPGKFLLFALKDISICLVSRVATPLGRISFMNTPHILELLESESACWWWARILSVTKWTPVLNNLQYFCRLCFVLFGCCFFFHFSKCLVSSFAKHVIFLFSDYCHDFRRGVIPAVAILTSICHHHHHPMFRSNSQWHCFFLSTLPHLTTTIGILFQSQIYKIVNLLPIVFLVSYVLNTIKSAAYHGHVKRNLYPFKCLVNLELSVCVAVFKNCGVVPKLCLKWSLNWVQFSANWSCVAPFIPKFGTKSTGFRIKWLLIQGVVDSIVCTGQDGTCFRTKGPVRWTLAHC